MDTTDRSAPSAAQPDARQCDATGTAGCAIRVDRPESFSPARIASIHHDLHRHPLLQLSQLELLAHHLYPAGQCRFIRPGFTEATPFHHEPNPADGRALAEVFRRIEEPGSWIALYNVEAHPAYRELLVQAIDSVRPLVEQAQPGIFNVEGFVFISAPPSVTPFHIDRENNFWLQLRGRKRLYVWDARDEEVVAAADRDRFIVDGGLANVRFREELRPRAHAFDVGPGEGVYFPSTSPHMTRSDSDWAAPGDGVSVSIGVVFYTSVTRRSANVHALNLVLRRFGLRPRAPGQQVWMDRLKYPLGRALVWARTRFRGYTPKAGF